LKGIRRTRTENIRYLSDNLITHEMPVMVVDLFKPVYIHHGHAKLIRLSSGQIDRLGMLFLKSRVVVKFRQAFNWSFIIPIKILVKIITEADRRRGKGQQLLEIVYKSTI